MTVHTIIERAGYAIRDSSIEGHQRHIEYCALQYCRHRDLDAAVGYLVPAPYGNDPELTRRIISTLETVLANQHPYARLRRKMVEVALAGERLILKYQETEQETAE